MILHKRIMGAHLLGTIFVRVTCWVKLCSEYNPSSFITCMCTQMDEELEVKEVKVEVAFEEGGTR